MEKNVKRFFFLLKLRFKAHKRRNGDGANFGTEKQRKSEQFRYGRKKKHKTRSNRTLGSVLDVAWLQSHEGCYNCFVPRCACRGLDFRRVCWKSSYLALLTSGNKR